MRGERDEGEQSEKQIKIGGKKLRKVTDRISEKEKQIRQKT